MATSHSKKTPPTPAPAWQDMSAEERGFYTSTRRLEAALGARRPGDDGPKAPWRDNFRQELSEVASRWQQVYKQNPTSARIPISLLAMMQWWSDVTFQKRDSWSDEFFQESLVRFRRNTQRIPAFDGEPTGAEQGLGENQWWASEPTRPLSASPDASPRAPSPGPSRKTSRSSGRTASKAASDSGDESSPPPPLPNPNVRPPQPPTSPDLPADPKPRVTKPLRPKVPGGSKSKDVAPAPPHPTAPAFPSGRKRYPKEFGNGKYIDLSRTGELTSEELGLLKYPFTSLLVCENCAKADHPCQVNMSSPTAHAYACLRCKTTRKKCTMIPSRVDGAAATGAQVTRFMIGFHRYCLDCQAAGLPIPTTLPLIPNDVISTRAPKKARPTSQKPTAPAASKKRRAPDTDNDGDGTDGGAVPQHAVAEKAGGVTEWEADDEDGSTAGPATRAKRRRRRAGGAVKDVQPRGAKSRPKPRAKKGSTTAAGKGKAKAAREEEAEGDKTEPESEDEPEQEDRKGKGKAVDRGPARKRMRMVVEVPPPMNQEEFQNLQSVARRTFSTPGPSVTVAPPFTPDSSGSPPPPPQAHDTPPPPLSQLDVMSGLKDELLAQVISDLRQDITPDHARVMGMWPSEGLSAEVVARDELWNGRVQRLVPALLDELENARTRLALVNAELYALRRENAHQATRIVDFLDPFDTRTSLRRPRLDGVTSEGGTSFPPPQSPATPTASSSHERPPSSGGHAAPEDME
ncbi:hypothetical protein EIP91_010789, partial [Steccherinum ochraceum]